MPVPFTVCWEDYRSPLCAHTGAHKQYKKGVPKASHFDEVHCRDPSGLIFYGIDLIKDNWRGGNKQTLVFQNETSWIYKLGSLVPKGLN